MFAQIYRIVISYYFKCLDDDSLLQAFDFSLNDYLKAPSLGSAHETQNDKSILVIVSGDQTAD